MRLGCSKELIITYIKRSEVSLSRLAVPLLPKPVGQHYNRLLVQNDLSMRIM